MQLAEDVLRLALVNEADGRDIAKVPFLEITRVQSGIHL